MMAWTKAKAAVTALLPAISSGLKQSTSTVNGLGNLFAVMGQQKDLYALYDDADTALGPQGVGSIGSGIDRHRAHGLLRARRERPRCHPTAEKRDEFAPSHYSMTSSARAVNAADKVMPSAVAVFRLIAK